MLAMSCQLNPDCEHAEGDMRTVRLGREFDRVFIHDAISYMTTLEDLRQAVETAFVHCRPGGAVLFAPDAIHEKFRPETDHGGEDAGGRSLRYLEWTHDLDPCGSTCAVDYVYVLCDSDGSVRVEHDRSREGVFFRADWLRVLASAGFQAQAVPFAHSEEEPDSLEMFLGVKPAL
jgi:hypothetical protein